MSILYIRQQKNTLLDKMITAQIEAKRFINWLEKYNHRGGYLNLGEALLSWCVADQGIFRLNCDYEKFLQMVIVILMLPKKPLIIKIDASEGGESGQLGEIQIPTSFEGCIPDKEDFFDALREAVRRARH